VSNRTHLFILSAVLILAVCIAPTVIAQRGQEGGQRGQGAGRGAAAPQVPAGPIPRLANGKPDLSGYWANPYTPHMAARGVFDPATRQPLKFERQGEALPDAAAPASGGARAYDLPYTEWGLTKWKTYDPVANGDYAGNCLPFGMSRNINSPHGLQIVHHTESLAFLFEQDTWFHWVPIKEGFKWPADIPESWNGVSTGRWDGDTLIIETSGFNGYTRLDTAGHPHSRQLKLTNTFKRLDSNSMEHTVTVHDPKTYTRDWMNVRTWRIKPTNEVIMEYSCNENNLRSLLEGAIKVWQYPEDVDK
jgi:hypothetical protein